MSVLDEYCQTARDWSALFRCTWRSADRLVAEIQREQRKAGEPESDRETISAAILEALETGDRR